MSLSGKIAALRQEYCRHELSEQSVDNNPIIQFETWFREALEAEVPEPNACSLGTASLSGQPSVRIILLKGFDDRGFVFFTNYNSHKGSQLDENPKAALTFLWLELERQVRIEGIAEKISEEESDIYFNSRPVGNRIGAWVSPQSQPISKQELIQREHQMINRFMGEEIIPRPEHWGGYRILPTCMEFWQGRPSRLHDRIEYLRQPNGSWMHRRLAP